MNIKPLSPDGYRDGEGVGVKLRQLMSIECIKWQTIKIDQLQNFKATKKISNERTIRW